MPTQTPVRTSSVPRRATRGRTVFNLTLILILVLSGLGFAFGPRGMAMYERYLATRPQTEARDGLWQTVATSPVRSIHAIFESTGNILLMAGTGNNGSLGGKVVTNLPQADYKAAVFDPRTMSFVSLNALWDVFCGGHAVLPDGNILVAGGTRKYELIAGQNKVKSQFEGVRNSAIFDVKTNKWIKTGPLNQARWYPTLVRAGSPSTVIAVSGLDQNGNIDPGVTEEFSGHKLKWAVDKIPLKMFPTYPALFQTAWKGWLFWSGANAGYGPTNIAGARHPGLWNFQTGQFVPIDRLPQPRLNETAGTILLPPAQKQTFMFLGGGGAGDVPAITARTAIVDLNSNHPHYVRGPDLDHAKRYPLGTILPDDTVLIAGGSGGYRADDILSAEIYNPLTNTMHEVASPEVGRDYHSEAILVNSGAVFYFGSNPLSNDNFFEMRVEEYQPPYFFEGPRPAITSSPASAALGGRIRVHVRYNSNSPITKIRLIAPSAYTHVTDTSQRSVAARILSQKNGWLTIQLPAKPNLLIPGYYMLFAVNTHGLPSVAPWIHITATRSAGHLPGLPQRLQRGG
jgi:hypothetical protein